MISIDYSLVNKVRVNYVLFSFTAAREKVRLEQFLENKWVAIAVSKYLWDQRLSFIVKFLEL